MLTLIQFTNQLLFDREENQDSVYFSRVANKSNLMLLKVIIFMPNSLYIIMILGLKGLEAAAVTAPGGFELPTIAMKGGNHHRRDFKHRNRNFRRRDNRRHNNGNESSENEKVYSRKSTRTR